MVFNIFKFPGPAPPFENPAYATVCTLNDKTLNLWPANVKNILIDSLLKSTVLVRGGVEDTRLEAKAKAKDTKKIRGQGQGQPFRGQNLSRPRTGMLEAKAKDQGHKAQVLSKKKKKRSSQKFFRRSPKKKKKKKKKKKVFTKIFQAISTKKRFPNNFSSPPQNFNIPKNSAVLEPRTGQFSRT